MQTRKPIEQKDCENVESGFFVEMVNASIAAAIVGVSLRSWFRFVSEGKAPQTSADRWLCPVASKRIARLDQQWL